MASIRLLLVLLLVACLLALLVDARRKPPKKPGKKPAKKPSKPAKKPAKPAKPGRPAKPGKPGGSKPKPKPAAIFEKYTKKKTGGLCWWDTTRKDCAICKGNTQPPAVQCGFPMHNFCYKKGEGCPWVKIGAEANPMSKYRAFEKYTLSTTGYPCYWNHRDFSCAWCTPGSYQCGPSNRPGNICNAAPAAFNKVCDGNKFGCDQIPTCHVDATCTYIPSQKGKFCVCNEGFRGNGIQCVNKATGTTAVAPETTVDITASFTRNLVTDNNGQFPEQDELLDAIKSVNNLCKGAFASCAAELNVTDSG